MDRQKNRARHRIDPETSPHYRKKSSERLKPHRRGETKNAEIDDSIDADHDSHSDRVKHEDAGKCKERVGFTNPLTETALFNPEQKIHALEKSKGPADSYRLLLDRWGSLSAPVSAATAAAFLRGRWTLRSE
jgi:hypothetical protein